MRVYHDQGMYEEPMPVKLYKGLPRSRCNSITHELRITNFYKLSSLSSFSLALRIPNSLSSQQS